LPESASWNEPSLQIFPNYRAPVVRNAPDGVRELAMLLGDAQSAAIRDRQTAE